MCMHIGEVCTRRSRRAHGSWRLSLPMASQLCTSAFREPRLTYDLMTSILIRLCTCSPSSDNNLGFVERGRVENGGMVGPRIFHTGDVIYGAGEPGIHNDVADEDDARSALIRIRAEGGYSSFSYKNYNQYSRLVLAFVPRSCRLIALNIFWYCLFHPARLVNVC